MEKHEKAYIDILMHIYIYLNCFGVHQKLTQHCKLTVLQCKKNKKKNVEEVINLYVPFIKIRGRWVYVGSDLSLEPLVWDNSHYS